MAFVTVHKTNRAIQIGPINKQRKQILKNIADVNQNDAVAVSNNLLISNQRKTSITVAKWLKDSLYLELMTEYASNLKLRLGCNSIIISFFLHLETNSAVL